MKFKQKFGRYVFNARVTISKGVRMRDSINYHKLGFLQYVFSLIQILNPLNQGYHQGLQTPKPFFMSGLIRHLRN